MKLVQKLKAYERQIVFMRWANSAEYGKIKYVGDDFIEFETIDRESHYYSETVLINPKLILEVIIESADIDRVILSFCSNLPLVNGLS